MMLTSSKRVHMYMFSDAVNDYMDWFRLNGKTWQRTKAVVDAVILPEFSHLRIDELTTGHIRKWMDGLALTPSRQKCTAEEALRKRKATANRYLNILKAILNKAYQDGNISSDTAWRRVKPFRRADAPRVEYLELEEIMRLVNACPSYLRSLVCGALYTGCRYSELARLQVRDYNPEMGQVYVFPSKNGKARYITLTAEGMEFFAQTCTKKKFGDLIFTKANGSTWKHAHQQRPFKRALKEANITKDVSFHSLRHTHASQLAMQGIQLSIIAHQLGHCDSRMAERHYAHLAPNYVAERIRSQFPALGINQKLEQT